MRPHTCETLVRFALVAPWWHGEDDGDGEGIVTAGEPGHAVRKSTALIRIPEALASARQDEVVRPQLQRSCQILVVVLLTPKAREGHPRKGQTAKLHADVCFD